MALILMDATTPKLQTRCFNGSLGGKSVETRESVDSRCNSGVALDADRRFRTRPGSERSTRHATGNGEPARVSESAAPGTLRELDAKMNGIQRSYELGKITDERLLHEFRAFYDTDPALASQYNAWIEKMPRSYSALLARGIYLRYLGKEARGSRYIEDTSRQQIELMSTYLAKAMRDYNASLTLTKKPLLTYHAILAVTMLEGDDDLARRMLNESIRVDPRNFVVRYKYFATLQTRWGGSLEQMLDFEQQARAAELSDAQLKYFANMLVVERRWVQTGGRCCK